LQPTSPFHAQPTPSVATVAENTGAEAGLTPAAATVTPSEQVKLEEAAKAGEDPLKPTLGANAATYPV
jgi:hypothetical protein